MVGGDFKIKDNTIYITPKDKNIDLICNKTLNIRCKIVFEFLTLISIAVLSFLLFYKLTSYLADFNSIQHKSRVEIIFLVLFFTILFIPMMDIDQESTKSKAENRTLAKWKALTSNEGSFNYNFGRDFNQWYNDRFFLRSDLIKLYNNFMYKISLCQASVANKEINKKHHFIFNNLIPYNKKFDLELISNNIAIVNDYCKSNNIKFYIVMFPPKEYIYKPYYSKLKNLPEDKVVEINKLLSKKTDISIIYPYSELLELNNTQPPYYRTDHHATDSAQFMVYNLLMSKIQNDLPLVKISKKEDFNIYKSNLNRYHDNRKFNKGDLNKIVKLSENKYLTQEYDFYDYKYLDRISIVNNPIPLYEHKNQSGKYKLFMLGDSFSDSLVYFLNTSFKHIEKYRCTTLAVENDMILFPTRKYEMQFAPYENLINDFSPDVLLFVLDYQHLDWLENLYKED